MFDDVLTESGYGKLGRPCGPNRTVTPIVSLFR
jgi:hypothetical protein